jgi:hypothetical protein
MVGMPENGLTRRRLLKSALTAMPAVTIAPRLASQALAQAPSAIRVAPGPFQPTWESLNAGYKAPDWFRDAKFGIWNHWTADTRVAVDGAVHGAPPRVACQGSSGSKITGDSSLRSE